MSGGGWVGERGWGWAGGLRRVGRRGAARWVGQGESAGMGRGRVCGGRRAASPPPPVKLAPRWRGCAGCRPRRGRRGQHERHQASEGEALLLSRRAGGGGRGSAGGAVAAPRRCCCCRARARWERQGGGGLALARLKAVHPPRQQEEDQERQVLLVRSLQHPRAIRLPQRKGARVRGRDAGEGGAAARRQNRRAARPRRTSTTLGCLLPPPRLRAPAWRQQILTPWRRLRSASHPSRSAPRERM